MGSELVDTPQQQGGNLEENTPLSYSQIFEQQFPYYLSIGMTYDEFYNKDCSLTVAYREAEKIRQERRNTELWLQGAYVYEALCDVAPALKPFVKNAKIQEYPKEPYAISKEEVERRKERDAKIEYDRIMATMQNWRKQSKENDGKGGNDGRPD